MYEFSYSTGGGPVSLWFNWEGVLWELDYTCGTEFQGGGNEVPVEETDRLIVPHELL